MRQPKPFIVEHKTKRTGGQRKPSSSLWGNLDPGKALKDVETESDDHRPPAAKAPNDRAAAGRKAASSQSGRGRDRDGQPLTRPLDNKPRELERVVAILLMSSRRPKSAVLQQAEERALP